MIGLLAAFAASGGGLSVSPLVAAVNNVRSGADCFAGVRFNSDGTEQASENTGTFNVSRGNWLGQGAASLVWIERTINSGTLDWTDSGAGRLQLNTTRSFGNTRTTIGIDTTGMTFDFYDAAAGGNLLATVTYNLVSEVTA